jgi:hypothetical protein
MPKRSKPKTKKRDWRWYASFVLNGAVALSMVLGTVFLFTGAPRAAPPTFVPPTEDLSRPALTPASQPTSVPVAPTPPQPTPTPQASADDSLNIAVTGISRDGDVVL